jgi:large subunit ribosomal protein L13
LKTFTLRKEDVERKWYVVDADGQILGRLASKIASVLRGKHKETFTPHIDMGDHIVVVNADKIRVTGRKVEQKTYYHHTGHPGGLQTEKYEKLIQEHPDRIIRRAVWGMLPHNRLGRKLIKKLKIYASPEHPHQAQQPEVMTI